MSLLTKVFGRPRMTYGPVPEQPDGCCYGRTLMPRWRGPEVMGDDTKAMGFVCHACGREYLPYQVRERKLLRQAGR
jgi:hypothetical protein